MAGWTTEVAQRGAGCQYRAGPYTCWRRNPVHQGAHYDLDRHEWFGKVGRTVEHYPAGKETK